MLFGCKRFSDESGLNWLQERGHISDNCINLEDVAKPDVIRILHLAKLPQLIPDYWK